MIYFDHAATSHPRKPEALTAAADATKLLSPGRGAHRGAVEAERVVAEARREVHRLCPLGTVCFTSGATFALNQAILGWSPAPRRIALGPMVHNAVLRPVVSTAIPTWRLPSSSDGRIDSARARDDWPSDVDLVVVSHGSNVNGVLQPIADLVELADARGAKVVVDAAQTAGLEVPLAVDGAAIVAFSAHKSVGGVPGVGALVVAEGVELTPLVFGGVGFDSGSPEMPASLPARLEGGTPNLPGIAAFGAAARSCRSWDLDEVSGALHEAIRAGGHEPLGGALPVASIRLGIDPALAEEILDRSFGLITRGGLHCAPAAHETLGTRKSGTLRVSASPKVRPGDFESLTRGLRALTGVERELRRVV